MPQVRRSDPWSWLRDVVVPRPTAGARGNRVCGALTLIAEWQARRTSVERAGRDESTRRSDKGKGHASTAAGRTG